MKSKVISISGPSGSGKTTMTIALAKAVNGARVHSDEYPHNIENEEQERFIFNGDIDELEQFFNNPYDPNRIQMPGFAEDLEQLINGTSIAPPLYDPDGHKCTSKTVEPSELIILEQPFGRARNDLDPLIDLAVRIDLPLEIALSRRIRVIIDIVVDEYGEESKLKLKEYLYKYLDDYQTKYWPNYKSGELKAKEDKYDFIINGLRPVEENVEILVNEIKSRFHSV